MIIHLGFTRNNGNHEQIADSLNFTNELFSKAAIFQVPAIINISSQSVYGMKATPPWTEKTPVAPETGYAQAKYATELMLRTAHATYQTLDYCSVRLGTLAGGAMGLAGDDFLSKFCNTAIIGGTIKLIGGQQQIQRLNIMDAVEAIIKVINSNSSTWKPVYNVSSDEILSLKEIAKHVVQIENEENGGMQANIEIEN